MLILYGQNETSFQSMGLGVLADAISCTVIHAEDGTYELELEYPVNGPLHNQLVNRAIIMAKPSHNLPPQPFRIDGITRPHNGKIKYYAKHISYDLSDVPISPYSAEQDTTVTPNIPSYVNAVSGISTNMVNLPGVSLSNFTFNVATPYKDTKKANEEKFKLEGPASAKEVMEKISSTYKNCMWDFRFQNGSCSCTIYSDGLDPLDGGATLGSDNGVTLYYGKDFTDIEQESLFSKAVSAIYPFWKRSSTSTTQSVSGLLLEGLKNFAAGESSAAKIAEKTGLDHNKVIEYIKEYMSTEPHVVDLSAIGGSTIGGTTQTTATDGHTGDGSTATFSFSFDFTEITQVTVSDKKVANTRYTINKDSNNKPISITFHEGYIPANKAEIKITGPIPDVVEIAGKIYAPTGHSVGYTKILPVDLSSEFSNPPPRNDLLNKAIEYWNQNRLGEPEVSIDLTYADIKRINEYTNINSANSLDIGDVVTINFVNVGIFSKVRITKTEYDPIIDMYTSLELGVPKKTLAGTIVETRKNVSNKANTDQVSDIVSDSIILVQTMYALGDNKTDPPQVVRAPGTDPEIDTGEDTTWSLTAPTPVAGKYLWSKTVTIYASGKTESSNYTCIDNGSSENAAAIGTAVSGSQNVYYVTTSSTAPSAPERWVDSTAISPNQWTKKIPDPIYNGKYYYCVQTATKNGNFTNSAVYKDTANSLLYTWVSSTNTTVINGGMIAANTVTASQLAADAVKSLNYSYTSGPYSDNGTFINLTDGSIRAPGFAIDSGGNAYFDGNVYSSNGQIGGLSINQQGFIFSEDDQGTTYNKAIINADQIVLDDSPDNNSAFMVTRAKNAQAGYSGVRMFWAGGTQGIASITAQDESITLNVDGSTPASIEMLSAAGEASGTLSGDWYLDDDDQHTIKDRINGSGGGNVSGTGTAGNITKWTGTSSIGNSGITIDAENRVTFPGALTANPNPSQNSSISNYILGIRTIKQDITSNNVSNKYVTMLPYNVDHSYIGNSSYPWERGYITNINSGISQTSFDGANDSVACWAHDGFLKKRTFSSFKNEIIPAVSSSTRNKVLKHVYDETTSPATDEVAWADIDVSWNDITGKPTIPSVTLNGSQTTSPSFYAPTSAGTSGNVLNSSGSGAPSWVSPSSLPVGVSCASTPSATAGVTLSNNSKYTVTVGGSSLVFKTPDGGLPSATSADDGRVIAWNGDADEAYWAEDKNTTYSLSVNGSGANLNKLGLTAGGSGSGTNWVTVPYSTKALNDAGGNQIDTYYAHGLNISGHTISLADGNGEEISGSSVTVPDNNTTYSLSVNGTGANANKLGLTAGGSGSGTDWVTIPYATRAGSTTTANSAGQAEILYDPDGESPVSAGSSTEPVYFTGGLPSRCTGLSMNLISKADVSTLINKLDTANANASYTNYIIAQDNGGLNTYYRRPVEKIINKLKVGSTEVTCGNQVTFVPGNGMSISLQQSSSGSRIIFDCTSVPCVIEGTPIRLANGADIPVEELQNGDEILSWDPNTEQFTTAVVCVVRNTGKDKEFVDHIFDDGSHITTFGEHVVYNKTKGYPMDISKFEPGDETVSVTGDTIVYCGSMRHYCRERRMAHYDISSSNNLYFAGGILNGKMQFAKFRAMDDAHMELTPAVQAVFDIHKAENAKDLGYENNDEYYKQIAAEFKQQMSLKKKIADAKQKLADSDYLVQKFTENLLTLTEWAKAKTNRASWRTIINDSEMLLKPIEDRINAIKSKFATRRNNKRTRFNQQCQIDNEHFADYKAMFMKGETDEK